MPAGSPKASPPDDELRCSFCGQSQGHVEKLIAGPGVYICNQCIALCSQIIEDERDKRGDTPSAPG